MARGQFPGDWQTVFGTQIYVQQGKTELLFCYRGVRAGHRLDHDDLRSAQAVEHVFCIDRNEEVILNDEGDVEETGQMSFGAAFQAASLPTTKERVVRCRSRQPGAA